MATIVNILLILQERLGSLASATLLELLVVITVIALLAMMLLKQTLNFLPRQVVRQRFLAPEGGLYDGALLLLQRQNLLLHRPTRDELVAGHHTGLPDAVGAVRG